MSEKKTKAVNMTESPKPYSLNVAFSFNKETLRYEESLSSINRRISEATGFRAIDIEDAKAETFETHWPGGNTEFMFCMCSDATFKVSGRQYAINLEKNILDVLLDPTN